MKIAITGASGDIGRGYLIHSTNKSKINILIRKGALLQHMQDKNLIKPFIFQDGFIYENDMVKKFTNVDVVIHFAALLDSSNKDIVDYIATNALLTALLAFRSADNKKMPKFIFISSQMVYSIPFSKELEDLGRTFVIFCRRHLVSNEVYSDLRVLAQQFVDENKTFPFKNYNMYALTKYLSEQIIVSIPHSAILRITNAYGPGYDNLRLIPRLIIGRLTGHGAIYSKEERDFVYNSDIHKLIDTVIKNDITGSIDCKSGEKTLTESIRNAIMHATPTAYGRLIGMTVSQKPILNQIVKVAKNDMVSIIGDAVPFSIGLAATLRYHKKKCYHQMEDMQVVTNFLQPGEEIIQSLKGSSAAYLFIVTGKDKIKKVRKVAVRDGVEGNGIAKVINEARYYKHITHFEPELAEFYPKLIDDENNHTFASETIEYLEGSNFYTSLQNNHLPFSVYKSSLESFLDKLCSTVLKKCTSIKDQEDALNSYYIERALSRLHPIDNIISIQEKIKINGKKYISPHIILSELLSNKKMRSFLLPNLQCFCFHGDLTLLNTVYLEKNNEIKLIDPRGHIGNWDVIYDFAKLKFSLSGFGEFIVGSNTMVSQNGKEFFIHFEKISPVAQKLNSQLIEMLADNEQFMKKIIKHEPHWQYRIALAEATHYLADIPFRLFTDGTIWTTVASYVVGTYYLNNLYDALKEND